jgi:hypothetical protein
MSNYPAQIDTSQSLPTVVDGQTPVRGALFNKLRDAVIAIESELGVKPSSIYSTVKNRLDVIDTNITTISSINLNGDVVGPFNNTQITSLSGRPLSSAAPTLNQVLGWDGLAWSPFTATYTGVVGGDLSGTVSNAQIISIRGQAVGNVGPNDGDVFTYIGSTWDAAPPTTNFGTQTITANGLTSTSITGLTISSNTGDVNIFSSTNTFLDGQTIYVDASINFNLQSNSNTVLNSDNNTTISAGGVLAVSTGLDLNIQVNTNIDIQTDTMGITTGGAFVLSGGNGITISNQGGNPLLLNDPAGGGITIDCSGGGNFLITAGSGTTLDTTVLELTNGAASPIVIVAQQTTATTGYNFSILGSDSSAALSTGGTIKLIPGTGTSFFGNIAFNSGPSSAAGTAGGSKIIWIGDRSTAPGTNPAGGFIFYSESGVAKIRSAGNTVTLGDKPSVTGSKVSGAALASLLTVLAAAGLITDNTVA